MAQGANPARCGEKSYMLAGYGESYFSGLLLRDSCLNRRSVGRENIEALALNGASVPAHGFRRFERTVKATGIAWRL